MSVNLVPQFKENDVMGDLEKLFQTAEKIGGIEYIFTLLRVEGITRNKQDALLELKSLIESFAVAIPDQEVVEKYKKYAENKETFNLLANLVNCATKKPYKFMPFLHWVFRVCCT